MIIRQTVFSAVAVSLLLSPGALAQSSSTTMAQIAKGPAASAIAAELNKPDLPCYDRDKGEVRCRLIDRALNGEVHYGAISTTGQQIAFVSVRWQYDDTGNAVDARGMVFVAARDGAFRLVGASEIAGLVVRDVRFEDGRITYETDYLSPRDSRASPTGKRRYELVFDGAGIKKVEAQRSDRREPVRTPAASAPAGNRTPAPVIEPVMAIVRKVYELDLADFQKALQSSDPSLFSRTLASLASHAMSFSPGCNVYDGDPRVGGAQDTGGLVGMSYEAGMSSDTMAIVNVWVGHVNLHGAVWKISVLVENTANGWRIQNFRRIDIPGQPPFTFALAAGARGCSPSLSQKALAGEVTQAVAAVRKIYATPEYTTVFDERSGEFITPSFKETIRHAYRTARDCNVFDGDIRAGGAQDTGGLTKIRTEIEENSSMPGRIVVIVKYSTRNNRRQSTSFVTALKTTSGWRVDDINSGESIRERLTREGDRCANEVNNSLATSPALKR